MYSYTQATSPSTTHWQVPAYKDDIGLISYDDRLIVFINLWLTPLAKTIEVTQLQLGDSTNEIKIVVSTIAEAEHLYEYLLACRRAGKNVNVRPTAFQVGIITPD